jgi:hypothetical protein
MEKLMFFFVKKGKEKGRRRLDYEDFFGSFLWERVQ